MADGFFLVWNPKRNAPTVKHPSRASAVAEAERLARQQPGDEFYVLKARSVSVVPQQDAITKPVTFQSHKPQPSFCKTVYWWTP